MSQMLQMAQVFVSKSGSNIGCHVAQIFIDIHTKAADSHERLLLCCENDEEGETVLHTLLIVDDEEIEREGIAQFIRGRGRLEDE